MSEEITLSLGQLIKKCRTELGMTRVELAEKIGTTDAYVSALEVAKNIVRICAKCEHGPPQLSSGWFITPKYILTTDHSVSGATQISVIIDDIEYHASLKGECVGERDLALLEIEENYKHPQIELLKMGEFPEEEGEKVTCIGYPEGRSNLEIYEGNLKWRWSGDLSYHHITNLTKSPPPGISGGVIIRNRTGHVVGCVSRVGDEDNFEIEAIPVSETLHQEIIGLITKVPKHRDWGEKLGVDVTDLFGRTEQQSTLERMLQRDITI